MKSPAVSPCEVDLVLRHIFSIRQEAAEAEPGDPCAISITIRLSDHQRVSDLTINIGNQSELFNSREILSSSLEELPIQKATRGLALRDLRSLSSLRSLVPWRGLRSMGSTGYFKSTEASTCMERKDNRSENPIPYIYIHIYIIIF